MGSLVGYMLIAIVVLLLLIGIVLLSVKKNKERKEKEAKCDATKVSVFGGEVATLNLHLDENWTDVSPLDSFTLMHYMRGKSKIDNSFVVYCKSLLVKAKADKDMYQSWFGAFIAYSLAYVDLARNEDLETMLSDIIRAYPNPRYKDGEVKNGFEVSDRMYSKLAYHVIYYQYLHKHNLTKHLYYDQTAEKELNEVIHKETHSINIAGFQSDSVTGYIYDEAFEENGIRHSSKQPGGLYNSVIMLDALYFLYKYTKSKAMLQLVQRIFKRISIAVFDDYVQLRGGEMLNVKTAKSDILRGLALCHEIDRNLSIGQQFIKQIGSLPLTQKHFFSTLTDYNLNAGHELEKFEYYSLSEGFILLRNNVVSLELVTGGYVSSSTSKFKKEHGYLNYGLNYYLAVQNDIETLPAGQASSKNVVKPLRCTAVPLDDKNTLFYVSHHTDDFVCDGYFDSVAGVHEYTIQFKADVDKYTIFNWYIDGIMNMFTINEKKMLLVTPGASYTISSSHNIAGTNKLNYGSIELKAPIVKETNYTITVKREHPSTATVKARKPEIIRMAKFDADFSAITPSTLKITDFVTVNYEKASYIIYTNNNKNYYDKKLVESITYKDKLQPITMKSMRIYVKVA